MASTLTRVPVLNSLLYVRDPTTRELPEIDGNQAVWSTASCVAISCLPDSEGDTEVIIGPSSDIAEDGQPLFDGRIRTPSRTVIVETVLQEIILQAQVSTVDTRLRIWTDGHPATEKVTVAFD
jgi:hypothetical protein